MAEREHDFHEVSAGLRLIGTAMVVQLCLVGFTLLTILFMISSKKADGMDKVVLLIALVGMIAQLMMVTGIFKFSHQPPPAPSAGLAQAAGALGIVGIAISGYVLIILLQVSSIGPTSSSESIRSAMEAAEKLPKIEVLAALIGFVAMVLLLAAAATLASYVRRPELERKAKTSLALVLLAAAVYAFVKLGVSPSQVSSMVAVLIMITTVQIAAFANILGTVRGLADAVLHPLPPELPRARSL